MSMFHEVAVDGISTRNLIAPYGLQYKRNGVELQRGTYRVRGELIDIFLADSDRDAVRVKLFDDEIENLSYFDSLTGEIIQRVPRLTIYPKIHYVTPRATLLKAVESIKEELKVRLEQLRDNNKLNKYSEIVTTGHSLLPLGEG